jgi:phage shock protein C
MFCTQCGLKLGDADNFCAKCGATARPDAPPRAQAGPKRLVRLMRDKKIAGVCAGWARYFDMDVTLMRILWLLAALFTGLGFIAYIVAWIAMPKDYGVAAAPAY